MRFTPPEDYRIRAWDAATGAVLYERGEGTARLFFRDGRPMSLRYTRTLTVRHLDDDRLLEPLRRAPPGRDGMRHQFVISADGQVCAETRPGGDVVVWDFARKAERSTIRRAGLPAAVATDDTRVGGTFQISFAPVGLLGPYPPRSEDREPQTLDHDGARLAGLDGGYLKVWNTHDSRELGRLRMQPWRFAFAPGVGGELRLLDRFGHLWSWRPGKDPPALVCTLKVSGGGNFSLDYLLPAADGRRVVYLSTRTQSVYVWDAVTGEQKIRFALPRSVGDKPVFAVSADGGRVALLRSADLPRVWNQDTGQELLRLARPRLEPGKERLALSRDARRLLIMDEEGERTVLRVMEVANGIEVHAVTLAEPLGAYALAADGSLLAVCTGKQIQVHDLDRRGPPRTLAGHEANVSAVALAAPPTTPGAELVLASASAGDGTARLWDLRSGTTLLTLHTGQRRLARLALSPSGRWLASGDTEGLVRLWDLGEVRRRLRAASLDWEAAPLPTDAPGTAADPVAAARRLHLRKRYDEAAAAYEQALAGSAPEATVLRDRGEVLLQLGKADAALADFAQARALAPALRLDEYFARGFEVRGGSHAAAGRHAEAAVDFARAIDAGSSSRSLWESRAVTLMAAGDREGYRKFVAGLLENHGGTTDPSTANALAWACVFAPKPVTDGERLLAVIRKATADEPENSSYVNTLGAVLCRVGKCADAVRALEEAMRLQDNGGTGWDWVFLALAHHEQGNAEEARKWRDRAIGWFDQELAAKALQSRDGSRQWVERLQMELLRREVESTIKPPAP